MPEILEDGGVYFHPEDIDSIVIAIEQLILNPELRRKNEVKAKELSDQYSWSRCSNETFSFLSEVANKKK